MSQGPHKLQLDPSLQVLFKKKKKPNPTKQGFLFDAIHDRKL